MSFGERGGLKEEGRRGSVPEGRVHPGEALPAGDVGAHVAGCGAVCAWLPCCMMVLAGVSTEDADEKKGPGAFSRAYGGIGKRTGLGTADRAVEFKMMSVRVPLTKWRILKVWL